MVVSHDLKPLVVRAASAIVLLFLVVATWSQGTPWKEGLSILIFLTLLSEWFILCGRVNYFAKKDFKFFGIFVLGFSYILFSAFGFWNLLHDPVYQSLIPSIMIVLWVVDTSSYILGSFLKGPKLAPNISPKKTWSGFCGGIIVGQLVGYSLIFTSPIFEHTKAESFIFTFFLPFLAQFGDLIESKVKRILKVKDSSKLIPGHGGLLDRLDSALIVFFLWQIFIMLRYLNIPVGLQQ